MWKRDEAVKPVSPPPAAQPPASAPVGAPAPRSDVRTHMEKDIVNIGKSVVIKGELNGSEDLTIEGHVEGTIQLRDHVLTIGPNGKIKAQVFAKAVIVLGEVTGNVTANDKVDIRDNGSVDGDIAAPPAPRPRGPPVPRTRAGPRVRRARRGEAPPRRPASPRRPGRRRGAGRATAAGVAAGAGRSTRRG